MNSIYLISNSNITTWKISNICIKLCIPFFFLLSTVLVLQQSGLSHYGTQQVCVLSAEAVTLLTFLLPPSCWALRVGRCQLLFSVTKERRQWKKKKASSIIYLITVSIRQSSRAQSPRGFCEALWNRLACKHAFKTSADKEGFMSLACLLLNHTPAGICTFKVLQSAFTREPRSSCISLNEIGEKVNEISEPGSKKTYLPFRDSCLDCAQP